MIRDWRSLSGLVCAVGLALSQGLDARAEQRNIGKVPSYLEDKGVVLKEFNVVVDELVEIQGSVRFVYDSLYYPTPTFRSRYLIRTKKPKAEIRKVQAYIEVTCPSLGTTPYYALSDTAIDGLTKDEVGGLLALQTPGLSANGKSSGSASMYVIVTLRATPADPFVDRQITQPLAFTLCP